MSDVTVKFDKSKLRRVQRIFKDTPKVIPKIVSRAINRTTTTARAEIARKIAAEVKIKISDIKNKIGRTKATSRRWESILNIKARRIPLMKFGAKQTAKGVSYTIKKSGGRKFIESAFIATMKSGHQGVFKRKTAGRLPIIELFGPSVGEVFEGSGKIAKEITVSAYKKLQKNIDDQIKLQLAKRSA